MKKEETQTTELINSLLEDVFKHIGIKPKIAVSSSEDSESGEVYSIDIQGDNLNYLIGFKGESLNALQSLLALMMLKKLGKQVVVSLDINNYKSKKMERLNEITRSFIDKVRFFEKEVQMPPMNPWERRQVHILVAEYTDVSSESTGDEPYRKVVLKPKKR